MAITARMLPRQWLMACSHCLRTATVRQHFPVATGSATVLGCRQQKPRNPTGTKTGFAKQGLPTVSEDTKGKMLLGLWKDGARTGREEPRGIFAPFTFSALCPYLLFSSFLTGELPRPASRPPGSLPTAPRGPSSTSSPVLLPWLNWLCQELGPFNYGRGCGVTLTSKAVNSLWPHSYLQGSTLYHLSLTALVATLRVSTGLTLSVSVQADWLWGHTVCSALWEPFVDGLWLENHPSTGSLERLPHWKVDSFLLWFSQPFPLQILAKLFLSAHQRPSASGEKPHITV